MSFLKRLGEVLAKSAATLIGIGPIITPLFGSHGDKAGAVFGAVLNDLTAIGSVIVQMEVALAGQAGATKFAAAVKLIGPILRTSSLVSGKKIADEVMFQKGVEEIAQGVVDILNSIHQDAVKTT